MAVARMLRNGQITIPKDVRDALGLQEGVEVVVQVVADGQAMLTVVPVKAAGQLFGALPPKDPEWNVAEVRRAYRQGRASRVASDAAEPGEQYGRGGDE